MSYHDILYNSALATRYCVEIKRGFSRSITEFTIASHGIESFVLFEYIPYEMHSGRDQSGVHRRSSGNYLEM